MTNKIKKWLIAIRPFGFVATLVPTGVGAALAFQEDSLNLILLIITLLPLLLIHTGTNLINDYFDHRKGVDGENSLTSSGLKRINGEITIDAIYKVAVFSFLISIPFGIYLSILRGPIIFILGAIGALAGYFYTATPVNYKYYGLGVPSIFIFMGPIMVWGTYYIQTGIHKWLPVWISLPVAFLIASMQYSNELRDLENDKKNGLKTFPIIIGFNMARYVYLFLLLSAYLSLIILIYFKILPLWTALAFITAISAYKRVKTVCQARDQEALQKIDYQMARLHVEFGTLLMFTIIISRFL